MGQLPRVTDHSIEDARRLFHTLVLKRLAIFIPLTSGNRIICLFPACSAKHGQSWCQRNWSGVPSAAINSLLNTDKRLWTWPGADVRERKNWSSRRFEL
jgi:hypothetical protein